LHARKCARYLAKYSTKSTELAGGVVYRVSEHELDALPVREHVRSYMREAFQLAADPALAGRRFDRYAHAIGYRGHCVSKSRCYSTTFKALRQAREDHVHARLAGESQLVERRSQLRYSGFGHDTDADAFLAASGHERRRQARILAREELTDVEWRAA
jgi:replication initiator protein RepSA